MSLWTRRKAQARKMAVVGTCDAPRPRNATTRVPAQRAGLPRAGVCATEHQEQAALIQWADLAIRKAVDGGARSVTDCELGVLRWLYAIPNGGARHPATANRLKAEGVKPGVPDLCLPAPRGTWHGLYIEMKRRRGGRLSTEQVEWKTYLSGAGYAVAVCKGWEEARDTLVAYLGGFLVSPDESAAPAAQPGGKGGPDEPSPPARRR